MPAEFGEVVQRLSSLEAVSGAQVDGIKEMAKEQVKQGKSLERIATILEGQGPRLDSHSRRLSEIEKEVATVCKLPRRVKSLEVTAGQRGFLAAVIGAVATALVLAGKWFIAGSGSR